MDRAALDAALELGLYSGGWCPKGRRAEDGPISEQYPLRETPSHAYGQRTEWNVRDSDATLILTRGGELCGGTRLTAEFGVAYGRPLRILDLSSDLTGAEVRSWLQENSVRVLNVAGPRQDSEPGIYAEAKAFLLLLLSTMLDNRSSNSLSRF